MYSVQQTDVDVAGGQQRDSSLAPEQRSFLTSAELGRLRDSSAAHYWESV